MSLFSQRLRPPSADAEEAVARHVAAIRAELEPDPLFRRRLRGVVVNGFVASREGGGASRSRREMGRLGRAVLFASVALAMSVGGVMAASQEAVPGDTLYPLKRQIERLRHDVLPAHVADELAALELTERVEELERLTESGRTGAVAGLIGEIRADYAALAHLDRGAGMLGTRLVVLESLVNRLPEPARAAVEEVIAEAEAAAVEDADARGSNSANNGGGEAGSRPAPAAGGEGRTPPAPTPPSAPASERPEPTPRGSAPANRATPTPSESPAS
jgi:hypothetical protein